MVSVWTLTGTFRRRRRVLGVDACLMRFYDPAMQKKSICNLRHLFKNITEFGVWYKYDVFGHFAFVLQMSVMWTHRSRTEDTFRVWNLFTARHQERFILFFYITDLYVWTPRIFKITFCKTLLWQRSWGLHVWGLKLNLSYVSSDVEEEFIVWASRLQSTFPSWSCCGAESALITSLQSDSGCVRWNECEAFRTSHFTNQMFWQLNVTIRLFYQQISTFLIFLTFYRKMWNHLFIHLYFLQLY